MLQASFLKKRSFPPSVNINERLFSSNLKNDYMYIRALLLHVSGRTGSLRDLKLDLTWNMIPLMGVIWGSGVAGGTSTVTVTGRRGPLNTSHHQVPLSSGNLVYLTFR